MLPEPWWNAPPGRGTSANAATPSEPDMFDDCPLLTDVSTVWVGAPIGGSSEINALEKVLAEAGFESRETIRLHRNEVTEYAR